MKQHNCDKMPKDWILEKEIDYWNVYSSYSPQETGMMGIFYCPWCGEKLE